MALSKLTVFDMSNPLADLPRIATGSAFQGLAAYAWDAGWGKVRVRVDGTEVPHRVDQASGQHLLVFDVPTGSHRVQLAP